MSRVLIAPAPLANIDGAFLTELRAAHLQPIYPKRAAQMTEEELLEQLPGIDYSLAGSEPYTRRVIEACPRLRVIARAGVGWDAVDVAAATEHGIVVTIAAGSNHEAVAEHCFALLLALTKNLIVHHQGICAGRWPRQANLPLRGRTLGIVGLGRIGRAVALRASAFQMRVLAYEPRPDTAFVQQQQIPLVSLGELLSEADVVSLHVPLTPESRHLICKQTLALMRPGAILLNTARGGLIHEPDLLEALTSGRLYGAGLDVFDQEPPPKDHPFFQLPNVVLTPHSAGLDLQSRDDMALFAARAIVQLARGDWPEEWIINPEVRETFFARMTR